MVGHNMLGLLYFSLCSPSALLYGVLTCTSMTGPLFCVSAVRALGHKLRHHNTFVYPAPGILLAIQDATHGKYTWESSPWSKMK